jgi:hypothetical protein
MDSPTNRPIEPSLGIGARHGGLAACNCWRTRWILICSIVLVAYVFSLANTNTHITANLHRTLYCAPPLPSLMKQLSPPHSTLINARTRVVRWKTHRYSKIRLLDETFLRLRIDSLAQLVQSDLDLGGVTSTATSNAVKCSTGA